MPLIAKDNATEFKQVPPGGNAGICYQVIDLGTHTTDFIDEKSGAAVIQHKVHIEWELPDEKLDDGRPMSIGKDYTLSLNEKSNLYQDLVGWRGREFSQQELGGFDLQKLLGKACFLQVVSKNSRKGKPYSAVQSVGQLPKSMQVPPLVNRQAFFSLEMGPDSPEFRGLSEWHKKLIQQCNEWKPKDTAQTLPTTAPAQQPPEEDDVPF